MLLAYVNNILNDVAVPIKLVHTHLWIMYGFAVTCVKFCNGYGVVSLMCLFSIFNQM